MKFVDARKIHFLTEYLQAIHAKGLANEDHTTLLLNCYTKQKDSKKLDEFIFKDTENVDFDVDIVIKVCRQSGYTKHAIALAAKHKKHEWYLKMQIEDMANYGDALKYISELEFESAEFNLRTYGSALMRHMPDETTDLLKKLCTDYKAGNEPLISEEELANGPDFVASVKAADPKQFLHLFVKNSRKMVEFLEYMIAVKPDTSGATYTTLLEHYLHQYDDQQDPDRRELEEKVMTILRNTDANYGEDQALILCQRHRFKRGSLLLFQRKGFYAQILTSYMEDGDLTSALQTCRQFGPQDPNLWVQCLQHLSLGSFSNVQPNQMMEIVEAVEKVRVRVMKNDRFLGVLFWRI